MSNTLKFGNGEWYGKKDTILAYNDENSNFKPLPFSFDRASSATVVNKAGLIETVGSGEPRIDFLGNTKGALKLEPQRTNLVTYSEDFSNWFKIGTATITSNYGVSPDGTQNSSRLQMNASDKIYINVASSGDISFTVYLKGVGQIRLRDNTSTGLKDVTLTNEWVRYELNFNATISNFQIEQQTGVSDFEIYGAQLEQGSYATSYIPTQGSVVTRVADACSNENLNVDYSGDYTLYLEHETLSLTEYNQFQFRQETSISYIFRVGNSISVGSGIYSATNTIGFNKFALSVGSDGSYSFYKNGSLLSSGSGLNANLETIKNDALGMSIKDIKLYNTRLSNAELQALTSN
jgi:hypothetical protein